MEEEGGSVFSILAAVGVLALMAWAGAEVSASEEASAMFFACETVTYVGRREGRDGVGEGPPAQRRARGVGRFLRAMVVVWVATVVALFAPGGGVGGLSEMWSEGPPVVTPEGGNAPAADMWYATVAAGQQWLQVITAAHLAAVQEPADAANGVADNNSVPVQDGERAAGVPGSAWRELSEGQNDSQETATVYLDIGGRRGIGKRSVALRVPRGSSAADAVRRWLVEWGVPAALARALRLQIDCECAEVSAAKSLHGGTIRVLWPGFRRGGRQSGGSGGRVESNGRTMRGPRDAQESLVKCQKGEEENVMVYMEVGGIRGIGKRSVPLTLPVGSSTADAARRWLVDWGVPLSLARALRLQIDGECAEVRATRSLHGATIRVLWPGLRGGGRQRARDADSEKNKEHCKATRVKAKAKAALGRGEGIGAYMRRAQEKATARGGVGAAESEAQEDVAEEPVIRSVEMEEEGGGEPTTIDGGEI